MNPPLETWERAHFQPGGGEPFLFYVIYGDIDANGPFLRENYRSDGVPDGIKLMSYGPDEDSEVPASFRDGPVWDAFAAENAKLAGTVARCDRCMILRGTPSDSTTLNYLRDCVGLISYLVEQGGCAVYDPFVLRWWEPADWQTHFFEPADPVPLRHAITLVSNEEQPSLKWFHTRGMRKFGRPEISVHDVTPDYEDAVLDLCERLIVFQAYGHVVAENAEVQMNSLPPGGVFRYQGDVDDPDFNNVHLDVSWPKS